MTGDPAIRFCESCRESVYLAETEEDLQTNIELGRCTAVYRQDHAVSMGAVAAKPYDGTYTSFYLLPCRSLTAGQIATIRSAMNSEEPLFKLRGKLIDSKVHLIVSDVESIWVEVYAAQLLNDGIRFRTVTQMNRTSNSRNPNPLTESLFMEAGMDNSLTEDFRSVALDLLACLRFPSLRGVLIWLVAAAGGYVIYQHLVESDWRITLLIIATLLVLSVSSRWFPTFRSGEWVDERSDDAQEESKNNSALTGLGLTEYAPKYPPKTS
jgi:hypothetical protein